MRAEYERRSLRLEEDIAASIQEELQSKLNSETKELEERMRQDVELAVARRREQLRGKSKGNWNHNTLKSYQSVRVDCVKSTT